MNTMNELLMPEVTNLRIAEGHAEAETRRWLREARPTTGSGRTWSQPLKLRLPRWHRSPSADAA